MRKKLIVTRNFLYRLFFIGFVFNVFAQIVFMLAATGHGLDEAARAISVPPYYMGEMVVTSIMILRMFLFYAVLLPAFALHWTIARDKELKEKPLD